MPSNTSKPKIVYIVTRSVLGGVGSHLMEFLQGFHQIYDIALVTGEMGPLIEVAQDLGIDCYVLPSLNNSLNPFNDFKAIRQCIGLIKQLKPDLIHVHSSKAGTIGRIAAAFTRTPVIFTAHGWGFTPGIRPLQRLLVWASEFVISRITNKIICVSKFDYHLAKKYKVGNTKQLQTIYNGVPDDAPLAQPDMPHLDGTVSIVMTARFERQKDPLLAIRACQQLPSNAQMVFVGDGSLLKPAKELAEELGIANRVVFLGDRRDVSDILAKSHIFLLSTHYEGLPISIIEGMRAGLPVVASDVGGVCEEVVDGENGFLVPARDLDSMVVALTKLVTNPILRHQMGINGREKFLDNFTCEQTIYQTQLVYDRLLPQTVVNPPLYLPMSKVSG
jgi:glycosyltransferase involved in cell wall biosynthesis